MSMSNVLAVTVVISTLITTCSVHSGDIPSPSPKVAPELESKSREQVSMVLQQINESTAIISKVQRLVQDNVSGADVSDRAYLADFLEPSEGDVLTFDPDQPEAFEYQLNNASALSMKTKSGGKLSFVLSGTINQQGTAVEILNAKLDVKFIGMQEDKTFRILSQSTVNHNGQSSSEWTIDFGQMTELKRAALGDETPIVEGEMMVHLSKNLIKINSTNFRQLFFGKTVKFEIFELEISTKSGTIAKINIRGDIEVTGGEAGASNNHFEIVKDRHSHGGFTFDFNNL